MSEKREKRSTLADGGDRDVFCCFVFVDICLYVCLKRVHVGGGDGRGR